MATSNSDRRNGPGTLIVVFLLLAAFWLPFSGQFDAFHLSLGVLCCAFVAVISHKLLFENFSAGGHLRAAMRFIAYMPWLMWQIVLSNIYVVYMVLRPGKIAPEIVVLDSRLKSDLSRVTLGNSITLTPGTITMEIEDGTFYVHAIDSKTATDLRGGEMEARVARVFNEV